jgi:hypothetical protein
VRRSHHPNKLSLSSRSVREHVVPPPRKPLAIIQGAITGADSDSGPDNDNNAG